jgi:cation transport ATPase-like protein
VTVGLTSIEARRRLTVVGENRISSERRAGALTLFVAQFRARSF